MAKIKNTEDSIILYLLLMLSCMNFLGRGPVFFFLFCIWGWIITCNVKFHYNLSFVCTLIMSISAVIASLFYFETKDVIKATVYFFSFDVGVKLFRGANNQFALVKRIVFSATIGYLINLFFLLLLNYVVLGHVAGQRQLVDFWTKDNIAVTLAGMISCVPIAYSFYCFFCKKKLRFYILGALCVSIVFVVNLGTATRTPFLLFILVYVTMLYELFKCHYVRNRLRTILVLVIACVVLLNYLLPLFSNSAMAERFIDEGIKTSRFDLTVLYINNMLNYPWGGKYIFNSTQLLAHNVLLESFDLYGFIFFIPFVIYLCTAFGRLLKIYNVKDNNEVRILLLAVTISIIVQIFLEPVIDGYPQLIWTLFLVDGFNLCYLKYCTITNTLYNENSTSELCLPKR